MTKCSFHWLQLQLNLQKSRNYRNFLNLTSIHRSQVSQSVLRNSRTALIYLLSEFWFWFIHLQLHVLGCIAFIKSEKYITYISTSFYLLKLHCMLSEATLMHYIHSFHPMIFTWFDDNWSQFRFWTRVLKTPSQSKVKFIKRNEN